MPKKSSSPGWKSFRLKNGENRLLPDWADKPLKFVSNPDAALRRGAFAKVPTVKTLKRGMRANRLARR